MKPLYDRVLEAASYIEKKTDVRPEIGIILGTGLGQFTDMMSIQDVIEYKSIPHFPHATVQSHKGQLVLGTIGEKSVIAMQGRFHFYEGYTLQEVTFPVRVMKALGVSILIITNASGGMNTIYKKGDIALITDHINLSVFNPLIGVHDERLGERFPDMSRPYDDALLALAEEAAREERIETQRGVYAWVTGPSLETRAEYRFMHMVGADMVGMSTVPEVIVGVQCGLRMLGISCITDLCIPETLQPVNLAEIIKVAEETGPRIDRLIKACIERL